MIDVDDDVEELQKLDRARVLIKTPWTPIEEHTVDVHIQGKVFSIHITEESANHSGACHCLRKRYLSSSEEIYSEDSDAGTPRSVTNLRMEKEHEVQSMTASGVTIAATMEKEHEVQFMAVPRATIAATMEKEHEVQFKAVPGATIAALIFSQTSPSEVTSSGTSHRDRAINRRINNHKKPNG